MFTHLQANWSSAALSSGWGLGLGLLEYSFRGLGQRGKWILRKFSLMARRSSVRGQVQLQRLSSSLCSCHVSYHLIGQSKSHGQIQHQWDIEVYLAHGKGKSEYFLSSNLIYHKMPYLLRSLIPQILSYLSLDLILNDNKTLDNSSLNHIEFCFVHINEAIKNKN